MTIPSASVVSFPVWFIGLSAANAPSEYFPSAVPRTEQVDRGSLAAHESGRDDEAAEWEQIEKDGLTNARIDAVAEYLRSTGQASS